MDKYKVQYCWGEQYRTIDKTYTLDVATEYSLLLSKTLGCPTKVVDENDNVVLTLDGYGKSATIHSPA